MYQCHLSSECPNQSSCEESDDRYTCLCDQTHVTSNYAYKTCECSFGHGNLNMGLSNSTESEQCTADDKKHFNVSSDVNFQGNMGSPSFLDCESPEHSNAMSHHCHLSPQTVSVQIHNSAPDCSHMSDIVNQPCSSKQLITCSNDSASCNEGPNENVYSHAVELNEIQPDSISHNQEPDMVENEKGAYNSLPNCDPNEENCSLSSDISQSGCYSNTKGRNSIVHLSNTNENPCSHITTDSGICHSNCSTVCACSHVCSICHVKVQVEWACASGSQKSGNGRSTKPFSFPKRVRHKPKAPTKDVSGSKKKKSPWSFRLNCRFKSNKSESAQEGGFSCLNMNCVSCVCPRYQISEPEQAYKNKSLTDSSNGMSHHSTLGNCSNLNPEAASTSKSEESNREEGSDVIKLQQSLTPLLNESSSAVSLPLTYNSVMDIQTLIERLLRLGICGPKYPNSSVMSVGAESLLPHAVHTQVDYIHCLVPDLLAITNYGFYWGKMDRYEAEKLLENKPEGTFLLRDSAQEDYLFTVSFCRYGRPLHARIEQSNHKFSFDPLDPWVFSSSTVCGLIEHYKDPSICMFYEPLLTNPLSRIFPFSLQHLSRAIICSCTTYDGINCLDLPKPIKNYLKEYHYKQRVRVRYLE